jgi:hypothetical protein
MAVPHPTHWKPASACAGDFLTHIFAATGTNSVTCGHLVIVKWIRRNAARSSNPGRLPRSRSAHRTVVLLELAGHAPKTCDDASFKANHRGPLKLPPVNLVAPSRCRRLFRLRGRSGDNRRIRSRIERSRRLRGHSGRNTSAVEADVG